MGHFPVDAWLDYVCGCLPEETLGHMAQHASECERCGRLADGLRAMRAILIRDRDEGAPDDVVEAAARLLRTPPIARGPRKPRRSNGH